MNEINEPIDDSKINNSNKITNEEEESEENNEIENLEENEYYEYKIFLRQISKKYSKRKYRELYSEIEKNKNKYFKYDYLNNFIFIHFQFRALFKIIERKFQKYFRQEIIKGIDKCLNLTDNLLNELTENIKLLSIEEQKEQYEYLTYFHLKNLYNYALLKYHNNNILDCISYLSLAVKIIQKTSKEITQSHIWRISEKIYLFITSILISRKDFRSAKNYLKNILVLCYKDFEFSSFINNKINNNNSIYYNNSEFLVNNISKEILNNLAICFYQLGCIFEQQNNYEKSYSSFHESNWICISFLKKNVPEICYFIKSVFERTKSHFLFYKNLSKMEIDFSKFKEEEKKKVYTEQYKISEENKLKKNKKIENLFNKMNLVEIDDDNNNLLTEFGKKPKSKNIESMTKNIKLLNFLVSEEFKPTITKMKNMNINKLDIDLKRMIQRKIISIKVDNHNKLKNKNYKNKKKKILLTSDIKDNIKNNLFSKRSHSNNSTYFKSSNSSFRKSHIKNNSINFTSFSSNNLKKPFKYHYDNFIFNKNYMKKVIFLEGQINREYKFQKEFLSSKRYEKTYVEPFDLEKIKSETDLYYSMELEKHLKILEEKNKSIKVEEEKKSYNKYIQKTKYILKEKICKSLNYKNKEKYKLFLKKCDKRDSQIQREKLIKLLSIDSKKSNDEESENINFKNEEMISKIINDIHNLDKKELLLRNSKSNYNSRKNLMNRNKSQ